MRLQTRENLEPGTSRNRQPILTERDLKVVDLFRAIRFAETSHLAALLVPDCFPTEEKLRRRLRKLARLRYLDRPARRITAARVPEFAVLDEKRPRGRPEDVWALGQKGADVLRLSGDWNRNNGRLRPTSFVHPLMITRVYATLKVAAAKKAVNLDRWMGESQWRGRINVGGEVLPIVPDAVFLVSDASKARQELVFLETDNHTMPLERRGFSQRPFRKKCIAYWTYWADELRPQKESMLVLTVAKTPERAEALRRTAAHTDSEGRGLNLFWFTSEQDWDLARPERFLCEPIWTTAAGVLAPLLPKAHHQKS